jgi:hypothetical protein
VTALAPTLQLFFTERLVRQRQASPQTVTSYRNTFRLLLRFLQQHTGKAAGTPPAAATPGWPRCARCSATPRCAIPSTPSSSSRSWLSRKNASTAHRSRSSPLPKPTRCLLPPTPAAGKDAATVRCSPWPRKQACGYPS